MLVVGVVVAVAAVAAVAAVVVVVVVVGLVGASRSSAIRRLVAVVLVAPTVLLAALPETTGDALGVWWCECGWLEVGVLLLLLPIFFGLAWCTALVRFFDVTTTTITTTVATTTTATTPMMIHVVVEESSESGP